MCSKEYLSLPKNKKNSSSLALFLHNGKRTVPEFKHEINTALYSGQYVTNIFYKDGENFHVRLGYIAKIKKSLKRYTDADLNKILHLRDLEKLALSMQSPKNVLVYYQPETKRIEESIRAYNMKDVFLNYSHILEGDRKYDFVENRKSVDYKIAEEMATQRKNIGFEAKKRGSKILIINPPRILAH